MPGHRFTAVEMIKKLVSFDTTSRDSNLPLIEFVEQYLKGHGVASTRIPDETGRKANLYATIGPRDVPGIVLSGHTDVVPVDGQPWMTDPFKVVEKGGRLYGRGTADMKSFSAVGLSMVPTFLERPLKTPIHFALSYDEEVGCLGAPRMIAQLDRLGVVRQERRPREGSRGGRSGQEEAQREPSKSRRDVRAPGHLNRALAPAVRPGTRSRRRRR